MTQPGYPRPGKIVGQFYGAAAERHVDAIIALSLDLLRIRFHEPERQGELRADWEERAWIHACWLYEQTGERCDHGAACDHQGGSCPRGEVLPEDRATGVRTCEHIISISSLKVGFAAEVAVLTRELWMLTDGDVSMVEAVVAAIKEGPRIRPGTAAEATHHNRVRDVIARIEAYRREWPP